MDVTDNTKKPLRIVVLYSAGHLGSAIVLNRLLDMPQYQVVGVVKATPFSFTSKGRKRLRKHLKQVGWRFGWLLFWQWLVQAVGFLITLLLPFLRKRLKPAWKLAMDHGVPVLKTANVNSVKSREFLVTCKPDLLVSAYFSQILKKPVLDIPKRGTINVHPGWLPAYRGAMAYFWVLKHGGETGGVTVHWIDEGIDTGSVIARRKFRITPNMTQQTVLAMTAIIGASLLKRVGTKLLNGEVSGFTPPDEEEDYYPLPGEQAFNDYFRTRRFFRIRDVLGFLLRRHR
jgi:folate-dependent phosphoribosylglycinamide formyltransferase PurN